MALVYLLGVKLDIEFQIASAIATVVLAIITLIQAFISAENLEYQRSLLMLSTKREHTKKIQDEVIKPLLLFFGSIIIDDDGNAYVPLGNSNLHLSGSEKFDDILKILTSHFGFSFQNKRLFYDLIRNHIPILEQLWWEFTGAIISLKSPMLTDKQRQELVKTLKDLKEEIIGVLLEATAVEVFRDECEFVRGTTKKDWTVDAWYRKRMSWCGYISWKLRKTKKTLSFWILKMALKIKSKIKKVLSNPRN